jgi:hypothetical protein
MYETTTCVGQANYETENEMYLMLEQDGILEENTNVIGITYYEFQEQADGTYKASRTWNFGKPYTFLM